MNVLGVIKLEGINEACEIEVHEDFNLNDISKL